MENVERNLRSRFLCFNTDKFQVCEVEGYFDVFNKTFKVYVNDAMLETGDLIKAYNEDNEEQVYVISRKTKNRYNITFDLVEKR